MMMDAHISNSFSHRRAASLFPVLLFLVAFSFSCQKDDATPQQSDTHTGHAHGDSPKATRLVFTDHAEYYIEYRPLAVDQSSSFAVHVTNIDDFLPVAEGEVTAILSNSGGGQRDAATISDSKGIFLPALLPKKTGKYSLRFEVNTPNWKDNVDLGEVEVFPTRKAADNSLPHIHPDESEIAFSKEQAWKIDFATAEIQRDTIYEVIRAGGAIEPTRGAEKTISATAAGILLYKKRNANIGTEVQRGESLFAIAGNGILDRDLEARFSKAKSSLEQAKAAYERKGELFDLQAVSKSDLENSRLAFQLAQAEYETVSANYSRNGKSVSATQAGYLKQLYKPEGAFVEAGEPLAVITKNRTVTLRADVSAEHYAKLSGIHGAHFTTNGKTFHLKDLQGRLLSYGKNVSRENPRIPVYFELSNTADLLPGSFAEVFIQLRPQGNGLLVPKSALLQEYGGHRVVLQTGGETYKLQRVRIGIDDGKYVQVLDGLKAGDRVVTDGAFQVKMASMSESVPSHGHAH